MYWFFLPVEGVYRKLTITLSIKDVLSLNGLPGGSYDLSIFDTVINRTTIRGSIAGTRKDMQEAISFAIEGKVKATVHTAKPEDINTVFDHMKKGDISGRIVL